MLREVLAIPSKGSGQQPWELRPPHVSLVGRRWLQPEGGSHLPALSSPGIFAPQGPSQGTRQACYVCRRCIQWEKLPERLGRRRGVRVPRGASVWPAAVDATFLENSSSARRGKGRTKNRTETKQGPPRGGTGGDTWALLLAREQAGWTNGHIPLFSPLTEGKSYPHNSPLGFFPTRHRETWISAHVVTKTDYNQTYEQIEHGHTQTHIHTKTHAHIHYSLHCQLGWAQ